MNILVTGGTGYIGSNLIQKLLYIDEFRIFATYSNSLPNTNNPNLTWLKYNGKINSLFSIEEEIDLIIHLATTFISKHSVDLIDKMVDSNILFGIHLLEFAKLRNVKNFINTATYAQSIDESDYNPQNFYTATKQAFEDILRFYTESNLINSITLSLYDTYGPNDNRPKFVNLVLDALHKDEVFNMSPGNQEIRYVYIDDVVEAFIKAIELLRDDKIHKSEKFSVCGAENFTLNSLISHINAILDVGLKTNPGFYNYRDREIMICTPKHQKVPGWEPRITMEEGIKKILKLN